jgi:hypothetical protein
MAMDPISSRRFAVRTACPAWAVSAVLFAMPLVAQQSEGAESEALCGALVERDGIRILHTWGTPAQRGFAHGRLLGNDVAATMRAEFASRFDKQPQVLGIVRSAIRRAIEYPEPVEQEIAALFDGLVQSGADRSMPTLQRDFDLVDLRIANALDVFGLMGCSGFTVHGDRVLGGGVLTGRNFDWPFTGPHMLDATIVLVQHGEGGKAVASVTWPGYVGTVTGINQDGVAAFLHVGSAKITRTPEPSSWPTAIASRVILEEARADDPKAVWATALDRLGYTSPPAGFLTRVVLPAAKDGESPSGLFEADSKKVLRAERSDVCVVTNHFQGRDDGVAASEDSTERFRSVSEKLSGCLDGGDHKLSVEEGWDALRAVQRGSRRFGTLHSLVFRNEPWVFELRLADVGADQKLVPAPDAKRRSSIAREALFARPASTSAAKSAGGAPSTGK